VTCVGLVGPVGLGGCASVRQAAAPAAPTTAAGARHPARPGPAAPAPNPARPVPVSTAVCRSAAEVQTSLNGVAQLDTAQAGGGRGRAALRHLESSATGLADAAQTRFGPEVTALRQTVGRLRGVVDGLARQPTAPARLGEVAIAVGDVRVAAQAIVGRVHSSCPSLPRMTAVPPAAGTP
jgi:hypothetical protein